MRPRTNREGIVVHLSAMACMDLCIRKYMSKDRKYDVLDFGSFVNHKQVRNHRVLLRGTAARSPASTSRPGATWTSR